MSPRDATLCQHSCPTPPHSWRSKTHIKDIPPTNVRSDVIGVVPVKTAHTFDLVSDEALVKIAVRSNVALARVHLMHPIHKLGALLSSGNVRSVNPKINFVPTGTKKMRS